MARYIDAEKAKTFFEEIDAGSRAHITLLTPYEFAEYLDELPAADVVEVVRKAVKGYEGYYEVDQFGRIYSVDRVISVNDNGRQYEKPLKAKQMKQTIHSKGYKTVSLTKDGKTKCMFVHRIVAEAFIPNEENLPMVNHKDEDKTNNFVENLEWCTASYNRTYGNAVEKQAKKLRGKKHTEKHKAKISMSMKKTFAVAAKGEKVMAEYEVRDVVCDYGVYEDGELKLILNSRRIALQIVELLREDERIHREVNPVANYLSYWDRPKISTQIP